jgi:hypothetical protein
MNLAIVIFGEKKRRQLSLEYHVLNLHGFVSLSLCLCVSLSLSLFFLLFLPASPYSAKKGSGFGLIRSALVKPAK